MANATPVGGLAGGLERWDDALSSPTLNRAVLIFTLLAMAGHFILMFVGPEMVWGQRTADLPLFALFALGGLPILAQLAIKLLRREMGADFLAAIAFVTGVVLAEYLAASLIILMLTGGQVLEGFAMRKASSALNALAKRMPSVAHRKSEDGEITDIAIDEIDIGDLIAVFPHETAPVDGTVIDGHGSMDESYLTGEPYVVAKAPGTNVLSGAINGEAVLIIRAEKRARDSRYAQIMDVMAEAEQKRPDRKSVV